MADFLSPDQDFSTLSLVDLLAARDQFHVHLMHKANVIGTAIGRYRIRKSDPWPRKVDDSSASPVPSGPRSPRTLANSEIRPYSWPAVLVFVQDWIDRAHFQNGKAPTVDFIPPAIYMPNGDKVPICVVQAELDERRSSTDASYIYPSNLIGGGYPILADVQEQEHVASVGCMVTDGHLAYALTNRHVSGGPGEVLYSLLDGNRVPIGKSSLKQLTRMAFEEVYSEWPGKNVYVNLDIGLIEVDDLNRWTTQVYGIGEIGKIADLSMRNISLRLLGCPVIAYGAASRLMKGEVCALFYRFKEIAGSEYVSDFLIGPRDGGSLGTHPGDSGTLWMVEPESGEKPAPIALQWGGQVFMNGRSQASSSYALATCLSTVLDLLDVDIVRDWNLGQPDYWGAVGHYSIATKACDCIQNANLKKLMTNNLERINYNLGQINKKNMQGLSTKTFVPLADVPDMVWKVGPHKRGGMSSPEHANHFADMDRVLKPPLPEGATLLEICKDTDNVAVSVWQRYYDAVQKQFPQEKESRGLLPFRVQQFYEGMVDFVKNGEAEKFVCAAGIVSHYVGDACQPLHISYLFNGDPNHMVAGMVRDPKTGQKKSGKIPDGTGVHSAYEDDMVNNHVPQILQGIDDELHNSTALSTVRGGHAAAVAVVALMDSTFAAITPREIVDAFIAVQDEKPKDVAAALWSKLGSRTIKVMADGCLCLAQIWDSAWAEGGGDTAITSRAAVAEQSLEALYQSPDFMPSHTLDTIGSVLQGGVASNAQKAGQTRKKRPGKK